MRIKRWNMRCRNGVDEIKIELLFYSGIISVINDVTSGIADYT